MSIRQVSKPYAPPFQGNLTPHMELWQYIACGGVGFAAGLLGGLAGVGGSILILPSLGMVFGYPHSTTQHAYMATAMTVNVAVAVSSAYRHRRAGAIRTSLLPTLVSATAVALTAGVIASNYFQGWQLQLLLALFLLFYCASLIRQVIGDHADHTVETERITTPRLLASAGVTGASSGLLGLGGGVLQVPLLQFLCRIPLRQAIATSSAVMCLTAVIGAGLKLATLHQQSESALDAFLRALPMAPTAVIGGVLGAHLAHNMPLRWVRAAIAVFVAVSAVRLGMAGGRLAGWW